jgi:predicted Rdx family selenoprotein
MKEQILNKTRIKYQIKSLQQCKLEAQWAELVSLTFHSDLRKLTTEPSIGASHQILVHFGKAVFFRNRPI